MFQCKIAKTASIAIATYPIMSRTNFDFEVAGSATRWSTAPCGIPSASAKTAKPTCQPKLSPNSKKLKIPETKIANKTARVEKFRTELKTTFAPFTVLVYEPP